MIIIIQRPVGAAGATFDSASPLYSALQVCISLVTVFNPDVMFPPLFNAANKSTPFFAVTGAVETAEAYININIIIYIYIYIYT
jgi:hypothetical protein